MSVLVKLLSGTQTGAEFLLSPGEYVIGSDDGADVVLVDAALRPRHVALVVGDKCTVTPLEGSEVRVDGRRVEGETAVVAFQVVSLSGVHFTFGPDGQWDTLPSIPVPEENLPKTAEPDAAEEFDAADTTPARVEAEPENMAETGRGGSRRVLLAALVLLAIGAGAYFWLTREIKPVDRAAAALREQGVAVMYPAPGQLPAGVVGLRQTEDGRIALLGLLPDVEDGEAMLRASGLAANVAESRFTYAADEIDAAQSELGAKYPNLRLEWEKGRLAAKLWGMVERPEDSAAAFKQVRAALDPRISLRREMWAWTQFRQDALREARRQGLADANLELRSGEMIFLANPWPDSRQCAELLERMAELYGARTVEPLALALAKEPEPEPEPENSVTPPPLPDLDAPYAQALAPLTPVVIAEPPPQPEPEPSPVELESTPGPQFWLVAKIVENGFVDQSGMLHLIGEQLGESIRIVKVWSGGVILQRGDETMFVEKDANIIE